VKIEVGSYTPRKKYRLIRIGGSPKIEEKGVLKTLRGTQADKGHPHEKGFTTVLTRVLEHKKESQIRMKKSRYPGNNFRLKEPSP